MTTTAEPTTAAAPLVQLDDTCPEVQTILEANTSSKAFVIKPPAFRGFAADVQDLRDQSDPKAYGTLDKLIDDSARAANTSDPLEANILWLDAMADYRDVCKAVGAPMR